MNDILYRKVGRRYVEAGIDARLYADGVWIVSRNGKRQSCVLVADRMPRVPMIAFHQHIDGIENILLEHRKAGKSAYLAAREICDLLARIGAAQIEQRS